MFEGITNAYHSVKALPMVQKLQEKIDKMDNRAFAGIYQTFLVAGIFLLVIVYVAYQFTSNMPTIPETSPYCATMDTVNNLIVAGLGILAVTLILIGAAGLIGFTNMFAGGTGGRK